MQFQCQEPRSQQVGRARTDRIWKLRCKLESFGIHWQWASCTVDSPCLCMGGMPSVIGLLWISSGKVSTSQFVQMILADFEVCSLTCGPAQNPEWTRNPPEALAEDAKLILEKRSSLPDRTGKPTLEPHITTWPEQTKCKNLLEPCPKTAHTRYRNPSPEPSL